MAWSQVSDYTPSGTVAAVGAGQTLQGGWIDESGNIWSVSSSTLYTASSSNPWQQGILGRPSGEATTSQRMVIKFTQGKGDVYAYLLHNGQTGGSSNGYALGVSVGDNAINIFSVVGGTLSKIGSTTFASAPVTGTAYVLDAALTRNADGTNSVTATRYASDGTTAIESASVNNDGTSALKSASGRPAMFGFLNGNTNPGLTNFQRVTTYNQTTTATTYTLTGPSSGPVGAASANFTVTPNANVSANVVVTPSDGGAGGSFTPTTVTFASGTSTAQTFKYTPASAGAKTISTTNNGGLTDPSSVTYTAANVTTIPVNSAAFRFSPGNWKGDTGRGGSSYRQTWNSGAYFEVTWTAAASSPTAVILIPSTSTGMMVSYTLNGVMTDNVAATGNITLSGIAAGATNTLTVIVRNNPQSARWNNGTNTLQIQGLQVDSGSSAGTAASVSGWDLIVGDSLTEGIQAADGNDSFLRCWSSLFGQAIRDQGRDFCINACGYSGWLRPGDSGGDVPAYYYVSGGTYADASSRWNKVDSGVSLLDSAGQISAYGSTGTTPTNIWLDLGTNEALQSSSTSDVTASVTQCLTALRGAAPSATLIVIIPFALYSAASVSNGTTYITAIKAGFANYQSANTGDLNVMMVDFGATFSATLTSSLYGGAVVHGNSAMHALEAARMVPKLDVARTRSHMALLKSSTGIVHRLRFNADGAFVIDPSTGIINRSGTLAQGQAYPILAEQFDTAAGRYTGFLDTITATAPQ